MDLSINNLKFKQINNTLWIPGVEICRKLQYKNPSHQAEKIWSKHQKILSAYTIIPKLGMIDSKNRPARVYSEIGARFFITKCNRPLVDQITIEMIEGFIKLRDKMLLKEENRVNGSLLYRRLTDQLMNLENDESNSKSFIYMNIAKNNCKSITGLYPKQLKEQRNVKSTRDGLTLSESTKLAFLEQSQAEYLKKKDLTFKEAYSELKWFSGQFIEALKQIE